MFDDGEREKKRKHLSKQIDNKFHYVVIANTMSKFNIYSVNVHEKKNNRKVMKKNNKFNPINVPHRKIKQWLRKVNLRKKNTDKDEEAPKDRTKRNTFF